MALCYNNIEWHYLVSLFLSTDNLFEQNFKTFKACSKAFGVRLFSDFSEFCVCLIIGNFASIRLSRGIKRNF